MSADDKYLFHQTPREIAKQLIDYVPVEKGDVLCEPFRGEGAFWDVLPDTGGEHVWAEIRAGRDWTGIDYEQVDTVVSNPPFKIRRHNGTEVTAFWTAIDRFTDYDGAKKHICLLGNDFSLCTLTPRRLRVLADRNWYVQRLVACDVEKWRGTHFFIILGRTDTGLYTPLPKNETV